MNAQPQLTILVAIRDEAQSIAELYTQASLVCQQLGRTYEVLWIDDGSRDGGGAVLADLAARDPRVRVVHLRREAGPGEALAAGLQRARGQVVVTLGADLRDDPAQIGEYLKRIDAGADLVAGWRRARGAPPDRGPGARLFRDLARGLSGADLHDLACGQRAYRAECLRELAAHLRQPRLLPHLAHRLGFRVEELAVPLRARKHGRAKPEDARLVRGALDLLTLALLLHQRAPLRLFGPPALLFAGLGLLMHLGLAVFWLMGQPTSGLAGALAVLLPLLSLALLGLGGLGELLARDAAPLLAIREEREAPAATRAALYPAATTIPPGGALLAPLGNLAPAPTALIAPLAPSTLIAPAGVLPSPPPPPPQASDEEVPTISRDDNPFARRVGRA